MLSHLIHLIESLEVLSMILSIFFLIHSRGSSDFTPTPREARTWDFSPRQAVLLPLEPGLRLYDIIYLDWLLIFVSTL